MKNLKLLAILFFLLIGAIAEAAPTFGAEFNFSNRSLLQDSDRQFVNSASAVRFRDRMVDAIEARCPQCRLETVVNAYDVENVKVIYPDGFYFIVATDPGVVEVQTKPATAKEIEGRMNVLQEHIFESARIAGLQPASASYGKSWAGSHIHIGLISALGFDNKSSVKQLRNFLVDFTNHSELAEGVFTKDSLNAPALKSYPGSVQRRLAKLISDVDAGVVTTPEEFATRLRSEVYNFHPLGDRYQPSDKYQAFNVNRIDSESFARSQQTMEIRAMRGQENAWDFVRQTRLLTKRLEFLADQPDVKLKGAGFFDFPNDKTRAEDFYKYVTEAGLKFDDYSDYLTESQLEHLELSREKLDREVAATRGLSRGLRCKAVFAR